MKHYYLNNIDVKSTDPCIFNTTEIERENGKKTKRQKRFEKERKKYGFDQRETWCFDYTLATWLYSHLKMYLEVSIVDLEAGRFDVPVIELIPKEKLEYPEDGGTVAIRYSNEVIKNVTEKEAIELMIEYLEFYICHIFNIDSEDWLAQEKMSCALKIMAVVFRSIWW